VNLLGFQIAEQVWPDNVHFSGVIVSVLDVIVVAVGPVAGCVFVV